MPLIPASWRVLFPVALRLTALCCLALFISVSHAKDLHATEFSGDYTNHFHSGDLVFQTPSGKLGIWFMDGTDVGSSVVLAKPSIMPGWRFAGVISLGDDAYAILTQQIFGGRIGASILQGTTYVRSFVLQPCNQYETPGGRVGCTPSPISMNGWSLVTKYSYPTPGDNVLIFQNLFGQLMYWEMNNTDTVKVALDDNRKVPLFSQPFLMEKVVDSGYIPSLVQTIDGGISALNDDQKTFTKVYQPTALKDRLTRSLGFFDYGLGIDLLVAQTQDHHLGLFSFGSPGREDFMGPYALVQTRTLPAGWQLRAVIE